MLRVYAQSHRRHRRRSSAHRVQRRRCDCSPLTRPHNLHYVEMPAAQGDALRGCRCAGCFTLHRAAAGASQRNSCSTARCGHKVLDRNRCLRKNSHRGYHSFVSTHLSVLSTCNCATALGISARCTTSAAGPNTRELLQRLRSADRTVHRERSGRIKGWGQHL